MKRKKINVLMITTLLMSQLSIGVTVFGAEKTLLDSSMVETVESIEDTKDSETETRMEDSTEEIKLIEETTEEITGMSAAEIDEAKEVMTLFDEPTTRGNSIDYTVDNLWLPLGSPDIVTEKRFRDEATVKIDGQVVDDSKYAVDLFTRPDFDEIKKNQSYELNIIVSERNNLNNSKSKFVDYSVNYGSSIVFESEPGENGKKAGAYTLHTDRDRAVFEITATSGVGRSTDQVNSSFGNKDFYSFEVFRPDVRGSLSIEKATKIKSVTAKGNDRKSDVFSEFGGKAHKFAVQEGDIVRTWSADQSGQSTNKLYSSPVNGSSVEIEDFTRNDDFAYYEVTKNGFSPITTTPLELVEQKIYKDTTDDELDDKIEDSFVNIPDGVTVEEFIEYPSRAKLGKATGKIKVSEKSEVTGYERVETIYNAPFHVLDEEGGDDQVFEVLTRIPDIPVGTREEDIDPSLFITGVYKDGKRLDKNEYTLEFHYGPDTDYVGEVDDVDILIELVEDDDDYEYVEDLKANIIWADTIVTRDPYFNTLPYVTSISLLENQKKQPILSMNGGAWIQNKEVRASTELSIYRNDTQNVLFSKKSGQGQRLEAIRNNWQGALNDITFQYGDVMKQGLFDQNEKKYPGTGTYAMRNEKFIRETEGYNEAYYELTKNGYSLLRLNQIGIASKIPNLEEDASQEEIDEWLYSLIEFPDNFSERDKENYRFELEDLDVTKPGARHAQLHIYETLDTKKAGEFQLSHKVRYEVNPGKKLKVELQENSYPVGTAIEEMDPNTYVKSVSLGNKELSSEDYTVSIDPSLNNKRVGKQEIKIIVESGTKKVVEMTSTQFLWGHSVVTKVNDNANAAIDASVSMLDENGKVRLVANEGTGFSGENLKTRPFISVYKGSVENKLYGNGYDSITTPSKNTMDKWNKDLETRTFDYGDVFGYKVETRATPIVNELGDKTWVSRDEKLVKETVGYEMAYYEMTKDGYRLMHLNQLEVNPSIPVVSMNTTLEEMNQQAKDVMIIPTHINNPNDYRFEYASVDTKISGVHTTKLNVYEKLSTGGEFKTTYDVEYQVNPQVTETFSDEKGNEIAKKKVSEFELNTSYQPKAENYISFGDEVYMYKGWLKAGETLGKNKLREGQPGKVTKEDTFQYFYEKADNHINMTIPTELLFGTEENSRNISSKNYEIKNNSDKVSTEVNLSEFKKEKSEVTLLKSTEKDPKGTAKSARLNVTSNGTEVIKSLTEETKDQKITTLAPGEDTFIGLSGTYFGNLKESNHVHYQMKFKFKVIPN